mmetsp:Transcript_17121/g.45825  ORF Transcript_17121/g.45825 Transcript_17121/m.45825 type:complete len:150 (-) Transcript_17121:224-673(-)
MGERTKGCIALRPAGNAEGSWKFLNLSTDEVTTRQRFTAQPMPSEVIDRLNSMTMIGQPLVEDDGEQSGGGRIVPAGGFEAIEAAATIGIAGIEDEVATSSAAEPDSTTLQAASNNSIDAAPAAHTPRSLRNIRAQSRCMREDPRPEGD